MADCFGRRRTSVRLFRQCCFCVWCFLGPEGSPGKTPRDAGGSGSVAGAAVEMVEGVARRGLAFDSRAIGPLSPIDDPAIRRTRQAAAEGGGGRDPERAPTGPTQGRKPERGAGEPPERRNAGPARAQAGTPGEARPAAEQQRAPATHEQNRDDQPEQKSHFLTLRPKPQAPRKRRGASPPVSGGARGGGRAKNWRFCGVGGWCACAGVGPLMCRLAWPAARACRWAAWPAFAGSASAGGRLGLSAGVAGWGGFGSAGDLVGGVCGVSLGRCRASGSCAARRGAWALLWDGTPALHNSNRFHWKGDV